VESSPIFPVPKGTSVYRSALAAAQQGRRFGAEKARPAYLSATAFADPFTEFLTDDQKLKELPEWHDMPACGRAAEEAIL
jgi:hypothetical protein